MPVLFCCRLRQASGPTLKAGLQTKKESAGLRPAPKIMENCTPLQDNRNGLEIPLRNGIFCPHAFKENSGSKAAFISEEGIPCLLKVSLTILNAGELPGPHFFGAADGTDGRAVAVPFFASSTVSLRSMRFSLAIMRGSYW